jgi:HTH-type transcriptional regulator / antitoxin HipB
MQLRNPKDIGHLVRDRRKHKGWTQDQFAKRLGVSRLWVVQLEQGKDNAQIGLVLRALNELDVPFQIDLQPATKRVGVNRLSDTHDFDLDSIIRETTGPVKS